MYRICCNPEYGSSIGFLCYGPRQTRDTCCSSLPEEIGVHVLSENLSDGDVVGSTSSSRKTEPDAVLVSKNEPVRGGGGLPQKLRRRAVLLQRSARRDRAVDRSIVPAVLPWGGSSLDCDSRFDAREIARIVFFLLTRSLKSSPYFRNLLELVVGHEFHGVERNFTRYLVDEIGLDGNLLKEGQFTEGGSRAALAKRKDNVYAVTK